MSTTAAAEGISGVTSAHDDVTAESLLAAAAKEMESNQIDAETSSDRLAKKRAKLVELKRQKALAKEKRLADDAADEAAVKRLADEAADEAAEQRLADEAVEANKDKDKDNAATQPPREVQWIPHNAATQPPREVQWIPHNLLVDLERYSGSPKPTR